MLGLGLNVVFKSEESYICYIKHIDKFQRESFIFYLALFQKFSEGTTVYIVPIKLEATTLPYPFSYKK